MQDGARWSFFYLLIPSEFTQNVSYLGKAEEHHPSASVLRAFTFRIDDIY